MKKILFFILILFAIAGLIIWYISGSFLSGYLSISKPIENANLFVMEGWLYDNEVEEAIELFHNSSCNYIVTTGVNTSNFFMMGMNGDLVIDVKRYNISSGEHQLKVEAYSTTANNESGRFEAWVNNEKVGGTYTSTKPNDYLFSFQSDSNIDSIKISFLNDALYKEQDINFYISSITIDGILIPVNDTLNFYRTLVKPHWKNILAINNAVRLKHVLMQYGVPAEKIIPVCTNTYNESRTAETARATLAALDSMFNSDTLKINIFSRNPHTKRTYLAYKKYSNKNMQIGIIPSTIYVSRKERGKLNNLKEFLGILYLKVSR